MKDMTTIAGKTIVLTGASRGIGAYIARALAAYSVTIVCIARSRSRLQQICAEVEAVGSKAIAIPFDLSQIEAIPDLIAQIDRQVGIDVLINNAGVEIYRAFPDYTLAELQTVLSVNLTAAMCLTHGLLPQMLGQDSGHIINIASLAGRKGHPYDSIYSASKAGLIMWTDAMRQELADTRVAVTTICPGYIEAEGLLADTGVPAPKLGGVSTPEMVAQAVVEAIANPQLEIVVNGGSLMTNMTKLLLATEQLFPRLGDSVNRWLGVTQLNQQRIKHSSKQKQIENLNKV
jgi:short-subunit dehydrogenase